MKFFCLGIFLLLSSWHISHSQKDTIKVYSIESNINPLTPYNSHWLKDSMGNTYLDSINLWVANVIIKPITQNYYLMTYTNDSTIVLEGDYNGKTKNGLFVSYDRYGRIKFVGNFEFIGYDKDLVYPYSKSIGIHKTYYYKNRNSIKPKQVIYKTESKKILTRICDSEGK